MCDYKICTEPGICGYVCGFFLVSAICYDVWSKMFQEHTRRAILGSLHRSSVGTTVFLLMVSSKFQPAVPSTISSLTLELTLISVIILLPHMAYVEDNASASA